MLAVALLGLMILGGAATAMFLRIRFLITCERTTATVSQITTREEEGSSEYTRNTLSTVYHSHLNFAAGDGTTVRFTQQHGTSAPRFSVGDRVIVRYSRRAPANTAEIPSVVFEFFRWFAMVVPALLGLGFLYAGMQP
jgi:Protein of unknown function (DUF3592)